MRTINPKDIAPRYFHQLLLSGVAPRPIAFVATVDKEGTANVSPFSFFNAFSSNPPVVAFSPAYRGTDGTAKDTLSNLKATGECTISAVTASMTEQISLASSNYSPEVDEFVTEGLHTDHSKAVTVPGGAGSPFILE